MRCKISDLFTKAAFEMMSHSLDLLLLGVKNYFDCRGTAKFRIGKNVHQLPEGLYKLEHQSEKMVHRKRLYRWVQVTSQPRPLVAGSNE